jgi:hypothetical protein
LLKLVKKIVKKICGRQKKIIDALFGWQLGDRIEDGGPGKNTRKQNQGDGNVTRLFPIPKPVDNASSGAEEEISVDPFNNGYWLWLPR